MSTVADNTPVLVGTGVVEQRDGSREPLALMEDALRRAADGEVLRRIERILIPRGRWKYRDPGRAIADAVGATGAFTVLTQIGILQSTLIGEVCAQIAAGELAVAAVVGGEAGDRLRTARKAGTKPEDTVIEQPADEVRRAEKELFHPAEHAVGLRDAVDFYALLESAFTSAAGRTVDQGRDEVARIYHRFSQIAADNPHAWRQAALRESPLTESGIRDGTPMIAFPYNRSHVSSWSVDQASALVFCAAGAARELGIPEEQWLFPVVNAESNHMLELCRRPELHRCLGAEVSGAAAFEHAGIGPADLDLVELYSCFPIAVQSYARELGIDPSRDLTVTGGMPFAGGPFNSYVLQATCRMAELLRERPGTAAVTTVSGVLTKQAVTIWSTEPGPRPFANIDVTAEVAAKTEPREAREDLHGPATVVAVTVLHTSDPPRVVALVEDASGVRGFGYSERPEVVTEVEREDWIGRTVHIGSGGDIVSS